MEKECKYELTSEIGEMNEGWFVVKNKEYEKGEIDLERLDPNSKIRFENCKFNGINFKTAHTGNGKSFEGEIAFLNCIMHNCTKFIEMKISFEKSTSIEKCKFERCEIQGRISKPFPGEDTDKRRKMLFGTDNSSLLKVNSNDRPMLDSVEFDDCDCLLHIHGVWVVGCKWNSCNISPFGFGTSDFSECRFWNCHFFHNASNACFVSCLFKKCDFSTVTFSRNVVMFECGFFETVISKRALLSSKEERAGISKSEYINVSVYDELSNLKKQYSGFQRWMHMAAVAVVFFPYLFFTVNKLMQHAFIKDPEQSEVFIIQLSRYLWNRGNEGSFWLTNLLSVTAFFLTMVYAIVRLILLRKTLEIELEEKIKEAPVNFSLGDKFAGSFTWQHVYSLSNWLFWVSIGSAVIHTVIFLFTSMPI